MAKTITEITQFKLTMIINKSCLLYYTHKHSIVYNNNNNKRDNNSLCRYIYMYVFFLLLLLLLNYGPAAVKVKCKSYIRNGCTQMGSFVFCFILLFLSNRKYRIYNSYFPLILADFIRIYNISCIFVFELKICIKIKIKVVKILLLTWPR